MVRSLKNTTVGFLVSFVGSIPLGYLNILGYTIYKDSGTASLIWYLAGVVAVETIVIYATLLFAKELSENKKLLKLIELFSICFMLLLAFSFYYSAAETITKENGITRFMSYPPLVIGLFSSCLNFIQLPFWTGWNLYLVSENYIVVEKKRKWSYLSGAIAGTFLGMLTLVLFLDLLTDKTDFLAMYLLPVLIPVLFLGMAVFQSFKFYRKYRKH